MSINVERFTQLIRAGCPDLAITHAEHLGGGQFSDVLLVNGALIFRFPKSPHVAAELAREIPILNALQGRLPLLIPNVAYSADDPQTGALAFMGYPMLPGEPLLRQRFAAITDPAVLGQVAAELAGFLHALHALPPDLFDGAQPYDARAEWRRTYAEFREKLFPHMRPDARGSVSASFEATLNDAALWDFAPCLCHGDFGTGNILYADGHVTGIIDFTFCGLGDPAQDLGALIASYGEPFAERVFAHYPALRAALPRARFIRSTYALLQALYALRDGNPDDFDDGMRDYV